MARIRLRDHVADVLERAANVLAARCSPPAWRCWKGLFRSGHAEMSFDSGMQHERLDQLVQRAEVEVLHHADHAPLRARLLKR